MTDRPKFVSGIFSVYKSERAKDFREAERYPIGLEAIFRNDAAGLEFAANLQAAMKSMPPERGLLYHIEGDAGDVARHADCFFKDVDALRRALNESLPNMALYHEEQKGVLPKNALIDQARRLTAEIVLCA